MAFTVQQVMTLPAESIESFFSLQHAWPMMVIRNWNWDLINYYHVQQLDIFSKGGGAPVASERSSAWVA